MTNERSTEGERSSSPRDQVVAVVDGILQAQMNQNVEAKQAFFVAAAQALGEDEEFNSDMVVGSVAQLNEVEAVQVYLRRLKEKLLATSGEREEEIDLAYMSPEQSTAGGRRTVDEMKHLLTTSIKPEEVLHGTMDDLLASLAPSFGQIERSINAGKGYGAQIGRGMFLKAMTKEVSLSVPSAILRTQRYEQFVVTRDQQGKPQVVVLPTQIEGVTVRSVLVDGNITSQTLVIKPHEVSQK